jgi:3',5'-cyclic AMP phosphodiesterase CpdA
MKVIFIGDIHGSNEWEFLLSAVNEFDHIVFVGDYVDDFDAPNDVIMRNLQNIIRFKKKYPHKVHLLLGNHEYAYVFDKFNTAGYRTEFGVIIKSVLSENWHLFDVAWGITSNERFDVYGNPVYLLATHAGLTSTYYYSWLKKEFASESSFLARFIDPEEMIKSNVHNILNVLKDKIGMLWVLEKTRKGISETGSPIWVDSTVLKRDPLPGISQVVGHTHTDYVENVRLADGHDIYFIDSSKKPRVFSLVMNL